MSIFSKLGDLAKSSKVTTSAVVILLACIVGVSAQFVTNKKDGVAEQAAEQALRNYGIEIDFSPENGGANTE